MIPTIVFDVGGVLLDWDPRYLYRSLFAGDMQAVDRFLEETGFFEWNLRQDEGRSFDEAVADQCRKFPQYRHLIEAYHQRWEESMSGPVQPVVAIVRSLKEAGYPLFLLSNFSVEKFEVAAQKWEVLRWFDGRLLSAEVGLLKPDERIYHILLERLGRPAGECLIIDDSPANVETARRLGFLVILYQSPSGLSAALQDFGLLEEKP